MPKQPQLKPGLKEALLNRQQEAVLSERLRRSKEYLETLKAAVPKRQKARFLILALGCWAFLKYSLIRTLTFFLSSDNKKRKLESWCRWYFKQYFRYRGVRYYETQPFPSRPEKPMLIITPRYHLFSSVFVYQLFKFPVLVPVASVVYSFRAISWLKWAFAAKWLKLSSYPDLSATANISSIKEMLQKGYSVAVHVNEGYSFPGKETALPLYSGLTELLKVEADIYFLNIEGMERYPLASFLRPILLRCDLVEKSKIIDDQASVEDQLLSVARFFGYWDKLLVS